MICLIHTDDSAQLRLTIDGETVPVLIQPSKQGQIYVLDRRDGKPLIPVEERSIPQDGVPGERLSSTQPFSTGMPDLESRMLTEADMWGVTPFDQLWCRIKFREARYEGVYTPPGLGKSISYPYQSPPPQFCLIQLARLGGF